MRSTVQIVRDLIGRAREVDRLASCAVRRWPVDIDLHPDIDVPQRRGKGARIGDLALGASLTLRADI